MGKPEQSVVTSMLDAAEDHLGVVDTATMQVGRTLGQIARMLKSLEEPLKTIDTHREYALEAVCEVRALRPSIRGRRTDLGEVA